MAQSASELKDKNQRGRKSTSNQMELTRVELMELDPMEVLEWEVERLEAGLNELEITIGASWTKSRKAYELNKALEMSKIDNQEAALHRLRLRLFQFSEKGYRLRLPPPASASPSLVIIMLMINVSD